MTVNISRRPSQEIAESSLSTSGSSLEGQMGSRRVSINSEGDSLAGLTQNVFRRRSSDEMTSARELLNRVQQPNNIVQSIEVDLDDLDPAAIALSPCNEGSCCRGVDIAVTLPIDQELTQTVAIPCGEDHQGALEKEEVAPLTQEVQIILTSSVTKESKVQEHPLKNYTYKEIDSEIDAHLNQNICFRFFNWMVSFAPDFRRAAKPPVKQAEEDKIKNEQKDYEIFIAKVKASKKLSQDNLNQINTSTKKDKVFKKAFASYQTLMTKDLRGYQGNNKEEKAFNRAIESIVNSCLKK
ncbi:MAG: hypothetical protein WCG10_06840 [Chlamydiota bacterium]